MNLPEDLHERAIRQHDRLNVQGLLFYSPTAGERARHAGFDFEFKASPSIARKPVLAPDAPERRGRGGPFVDPDPAFVVARPGPDHVLELSMHAMLRPHYVLHTRLFAPQTDDLDHGDLAAAWAVMQRVAAAAATGATGGQGPPMMLYNCGYAGGASQGHKHVQVFVAPDPGFALFPDRVPDGGRAAHVPFQHMIARLDGPGPPVDPTRLLATYQRLLGQVRAAHAAHRARHPDEAHEAGCSMAAYNVVLTPQWMCLIPRRRGGKDGTGAGSLGMLGLLWLRDADERAHWTQLGMTEHLVWMGLPWEDSNEA